MFIGPVNIAGIATGLAHGLLEAGVQAQVVLSAPDPFNYSTTKAPVAFRLWQQVGLKRMQTPRNRLFLKILYVLLHKMLGYLFLPWAILNFQAFIFLFGQTLTDSAFELKLLKLLKKKIIFVYVGSDARPPYMDGGQFPSGMPIPSATSLRKLSRQRKALISRHEKYADFIVNSPFSAQFQEKRFINWFAMGVPRQFVELDVNCRKAPNGHPAVVKILHSPSNPAVKGTNQIIAALDRLKERGVKFELVMLQNMSNARVIEEIQQCDFVIDQLYSDTPMAVFAAEAAYFGKPAVVGSYCVGQPINLYGPAGIPPSEFVHPDELEEAIERLIMDHPYRHELGQSAAQFVHTYWKAKAVAWRYLSLLNDQVPPDWWVEPHQVTHVLGCGMSAEHACLLAESLLQQYGELSFELGNKPELCMALQELIDTYKGGSKND